MLGGEIKVVMTLDDKDFSIKTVNAGKIVQELKRNIEQTASSTKVLEERFTSFGQRFRDLTFTISVARFALHDINDIFLSLPRAVMKASGEIERTTKLLEGLSDQTEDTARKLEAASNVKFVFDMSKNAPFQVSALTDTFVKLKTAGIDPTNGSMETLVNSVAKFGGTSEHLHRASIAIQQMAGKGVISMEELRQQLGEAIPNAMQAMAVGTGMSMAEMVKRISKGEVEAKSALDRMMAVMDMWNKNAAEAMMDTWNGQLEKLKTNFMLFANNIGQSGFFDTIKAQLQELNKWLSSDDARAMAQKLAFAFTDIANAIGATVGFVRKYIDEFKALATVWAALWTMKTMRTGIEGALTMLGNLNKSYQSGMASIVAAERNRYAAVVGLRAREAAETTAIENKLLLDKQQALSRELASLRAINAAKMAESQRYYEQALVAERVVNTQRLANGRFASAAEIANQKLVMDGYMKKSAAAQIAAVKIAQSEIAVRNQILLTNEAIAGQAALTAARVATATGVIARSIAGMAALGRGALALLGGPIGLITTALTLGGMAWLEWGNKAEEAVRKAQDALKNGMADGETIKTFTEKKGELMTREAAILAQLQKLESSKAAEESMVGKGNYTGSDYAINNLKAKLAEVREEIKKTTADVTTATTQATENAVAGSVRKNQEAVEKNLKIIEDGSQKELRALNESYKNKAKDTGEYSKALSDIAVRGYQKQADLIDASIKNVEKRMKGATGTALAGFQAQKANLERMYNEMQERVNSAGAIGTNPTFIGGNKGDKGSGSDASMESRLSPIQRLIDSLKAKRADLQAEVEGLSGDYAKLEYELNHTDKYVGKKSGAPSDEEKNMALWIQSQIDQYQKMKEAREKAVSDAKSALEKMKDVSRDTKVSMAEAISAFYGEDDSKNKRIITLKKNLGDMKEALEIAAAMGGETGKQAQEALKGWDEFFNRVVGQEQTANLQQFVTPFKGQIDQLNAQLDEDDRVAKINRVRAEVDHQRDLLEIKIAAMGDERTLTMEQIQFIANARLAFEEYAAAKIAVANRQNETSMQKLAREWQNTTKQMQDATASWAQKSIDAMMNFVKTGKFEFKNLVESILEDLLRIQMQRQLANGVMPLLDSAATAAGDWLSGMFSFANGGIMTDMGAVELRKYASGGIANSPQLALYGEGSMPEAFVPLPDGRSIPVTMTGAGGQAKGGDVTVNVINQTSMPVTASKGQPRFDGKQMILDIVLTAASQPGAFREGMKGALT